MDIASVYIVAPKHLCTASASGRPKRSGGGKMAPAVGAVITTPERRDPEASAVARPVNKAPARRAVITTPQSGGTFARVPPASNSTMSARIEAARPRPSWGSVHESRSGMLDAPLNPFTLFKATKGMTALGSARGAKQPQAFPSACSNEPAHPGPVFQQPRVRPRWQLPAHHDRARPHRMPPGL
jgi:hypothetical protein